MGKDKSGLNTRSITLTNEPLKEWLYYICDDRCIEVKMLQVEPRRFSGRVTLTKVRIKKQDKTES